MNLNDTVRIKIKPFGMKILYDEHDELRKMFPKLGPFMPPAFDADGYHHMQLWRVMEVFGPHIHLGGTAPIETEILVSGAERQAIQEE